MMTRSTMLRRTTLFMMFGMLWGVFLPLPASAVVPQTINYQGHLTDSGGTPVNSPVNITFSIYSSPTDTLTPPLWTETQTEVTVNGGTFSVVLGSGTPITLAFDSQYYLGIKVGTDPEMTPRQALTSAPYAIRAGSVDTVNGSAIVGTVAAAALPVGTTAGTVAEGNDARFTDARNPLSGSTNYIQNQSASPQTASFNISGTGAVGGNLSAGGSIQVNNDTAACDASKAGTIRWSSGMSDFEGCDGGTWVSLKFVKYLQVGTTAQRPANPITGQLYFNTTTNSVNLWTGSGWATVHTSDNLKTYTSSSTLSNGAMQAITLTGMTSPPQSVTAWRDTGGGVWENVAGNTSYPIRWNSGTASVSITNNSGTTQSMYLVVTGSVP